MRRAKWFACVAGVVALAMIVTTPAAAQAKPAAKEVKASSAKTLLVSWKYLGKRLVEMAEDFPEDKYDFKPKPEQRSFAEQLLHAAGANYAFINAATGKKPDEMEFPRAKYPTKADVVAAVKKSFADGAAAIEAKGDAGMDEIIQNPWYRMPTRLSELGYQAAMHASEHYGQLVVYYRLNNLVPPESRPKK